MIVHILKFEFSGKWNHLRKTMWKKLKRTKITCSQFSLSHLFLSRVVVVISSPFHFKQNWQPTTCRVLPQNILLFCLLTWCIFPTPAQPEHDSSASAVHITSRFHVESAKQKLIIFVVCHSVLFNRLNIRCFANNTSANSFPDEF